MPDPRVIAFYLPQFHTIPENDEWWGEGFTEWTNVMRARPLFKDHYQPHIPADLGYYDLRNEKARIAQAELARKFGIYGFCYYHYWFNDGKMLLEEPFNEVIKTGKPDFPFCLCWANENWTRMWDGLEKEVLMEQNYDEYDPKKHILWLERAFSDSRYIRINGNPLLLIYNAYGIPDIKDKIAVWRRVIKEKGYNDLYLCSVKSYSNKYKDNEMINLGFDAVIEFYPNRETLPNKKFNSLLQFYFSGIINKIITIFRLETKLKKLPINVIYSYKAMVNNIIRKKINNDKILPCVIPSWDNSPRRRIWATIIQNEDPEIFKNWLDYSFKRVIDKPSEEKMVFINAWNEWAEGCHLEPDMKNDKKFLEATLEIVNKWKSNNK